jgi:5'-3' exonuclease
MVKPTQCLLNAFNVQWIMVSFFFFFWLSSISILTIQAAGEAKAQLALMNNAGIIDAVMTDDSDAFVFGAQTVLHK